MGQQHKLNWTLPLTATTVCILSITHCGNVSGKTHKYGKASVVYNMNVFYLARWYSGVNKQSLTECEHIQNGIYGARLYHHTDGHIEGVNVEWVCRSQQCNINSTVINKVRALSNPMYGTLVRVSDNVYTFQPVCEDDRIALDNLGKEVLNARPIFDNVPVKYTTNVGHKSDSHKSQ